jgi:hypothetical protein
VSIADTPSGSSAHIYHFHFLLASIHNNLTVNARSPHKKYIQIHPSHTSHFLLPAPQPPPPTTTSRAMCEISTVYYPCREHVAMRTTTQPCGRATITTTPSPPPRPHTHPHNNHHHHHHHHHTLGSSAPRLPPPLPPPHRPSPPSCHSPPDPMPTTPWTACSPARRGWWCVLWSRHRRQR